MIYAHQVLMDNQLQRSAPSIQTMLFIYILSQPQQREKNYIDHAQHIWIHSIYDRADLGFRPVMQSLIGWA